MRAPRFPFFLFLGFYLSVASGVSRGDSGDVAIFREVAGTDNVTTNGFTHDWDTTVRVDADSYVLAGDTANVLCAAGHHLVLYSARFDDPGDNGNNRSEIQSHLRLAGADVPIGWSQGYIRRNNGQFACVAAGGGIIEVAGDGDAVLLHSLRTDANTDGVIREPDAAGIQLLKLDDSWDYCRLRLALLDTAGPNSGTYAAVPYIQQDELDTGSFGHDSGGDPTSITLKTPGHYLVVCNTYCRFATLTSGTRTLVRQRLTLGGTEVPGSSSTVYLRGNTDDMSCMEGAASLAMIIETTVPNQALKVECNLNTGAAVNYVKDRTAISIVKLPEAGEYIRLDDSGTDNVNPPILTALGWDTELERDRFGFLHDDSRITAPDDDDYLFFCTLFDNDGDGGNSQRTMYWQRWRLNGADVLPYGQGGRFGRDTQGAEQCGNWSGLLVGMASGDYVETVSSQLGNAGTVSADIKGLQGVRLSTLFTPMDQPRISAADGATGVNTTSAWINATLTWTGATPTEVWAYWGATDEGTNLTWANSAYYGTNAAAVPVAYSSSVAGLAPGSTYVYRFRARNSAADVWTGAQMFRTFTAPTVENSGAATGPGYARLTGNMPLGDMANVMIYWGDSDGGTDHAAWGNTNALGTLANGHFHADTRWLTTEPWTNGGFESLDIGVRGMLGNTSEANGAWTLTGSGADIWTTRDECHFACRTVSGDFDVYCRVGTYVGGTHAWRKAGIMARETLDHGSRNVAMLRTPTNGNARFTLQRREVAGADSVSEHYVSNLADEFYWARLVRQGDVFSAYWAVDNAGTPGPWTNEHADVTVPMGSDVHLGLAVTAHNIAQQTTITFSDLTGDVHPAEGNLLYGVPYYFRCYATNDYGDDWDDGATSFLTEPEVVTRTEYRAGLGAANVPGGWFDTWPNPATNSVLGPEAARTQGDWPATSTFIYSGEVYLDGSPYVFVESIDDDVWLKLDGIEVINNGAAWDRSSSGIIDKPAGWYDFQLRFYQNAGGSGYNWLNPGFQYNDNGVDSLSEKDNAYPEDDGSMSLFRHVVEVTENVNSIANTAPSGAGPTGATLNGTLEGRGAVFDVYVYWGTTDGGASAVAWANTNLVAVYTSSASIPLAYVASGLAPDTEHFYTFEARNAAGSLWAAPSVSFRTVVAPAIDTDAATAVASSSAVLNADLLAGGSADVAIYWGTSDVGATPGGWMGTNALGTEANGAVATGVAGLTANQTYYYRSYATNASGDSWSASTASFTTLPPEITIADAMVTEPNSGDTTGAVFVVSLSGVSALPVSVDFETAAGSAAPGDFVPTNGTLTMGVGALSGDIVVSVRGDALDEGVAEEFAVSLSGAVDATIADSVAVGTITDNETDLDAWKYRLKIVFSGYRGNETLTNFPALVVFNESIPEFIYSALGSPTGNDLRFTDASETTLLNYEIEEWNTNGDSFVWVQVPELVDSNTYIWAYGGNPYRTEVYPSQTDGSVWSEGFEGVWHMNDPSPLDSTAYERHGVANDEPLVVNGPISTALSYDGVDDWATVDYVGVARTQSRTVTAWINKAAGSPANKTILSWGRNTASQKWVYRTQDGNGTVDGNLRVEINGGYQLGTTDMRDGQWHHVAAVFAEDTNPNVNDLVHFVDGVTNGVDVTQGQALDTREERPFMLGGESWNTAHIWDGLLDEVRIASVARSADWLMAEHLSVTSNNTFMTYEAAGPADAPAPLITIAADPANLRDTSVDVSSAVLSTGTAQTVVSVYWGTEDGGQEPLYWANSNRVGTVTQAPPVMLPAGLSGLTANTRYYYAFQAVNANGDDWAPGIFRTHGQPTIRSAPATDVTIATATLNGDLIDGGIGVVSLLWGFSDEGAGLVNWDATNTFSMSANGTFARPVTPLANGTYYYRAYVTNDYGSDWADASETFVTPLAELSIADVNVTEGGSPTSAVFTVSLTAASAKEVTVDYTTVDGVAKAGSDYTATTGVLQIAVGTPSAIIAVPITSDGDNEWPGEDFLIELRNVTHAIMVTSNATGVIVDDDGSSLQAWRYKMKIEFPGYTGPGTLTNFPALVVFGPSLQGFNYGQPASTEGFDLRFSDESRTQLLDYEIEDWNTNGGSYVWVRLPTLAAGDAIWAYWGNPAKTYPVPSLTDGSVWDSSHLAVYHLDLTNSATVGTNTVIVTPDASGAVRDAVRVASPTNPAVPRSAPGLIAGAQEFAGIQGGVKETTANNMHYYRYDLVPDQVHSQFTFMAWAKAAVVVQDQYASIFNSDAPGITPADDFQIDFNNATPRSWRYHNGTDANIGAVTTNWVHLAVTCDSALPTGNIQLYYDGQNSGTIGAHDIAFGHYQIGCNRTPDHCLEGLIDELRIMNRPASAAWIDAAWENSGRNSAFNAYGIVDDRKGGTLLLLR